MDPEGNPAPPIRHTKYMQSNWYHAFLRMRSRSDGFNNRQRSDRTADNSHFWYVFKSFLPLPWYWHNSTKEAEIKFSNTECGNRTGGYQISVLVLRHRSPDYSLSEFSNEIFNSWGIADSYCGNGVLLFVSFHYVRKRSPDLIHTIYNGNFMHVTMGGVRKILTGPMIQIVFNRVSNSHNFNYAREIYASVHRMGTILTGISLRQENLRCTSRWIRVQ